VGANDFFNELAEKWDEINRYPMEKLEIMLDKLGIKPGDTVLDTGSGTGILLPLIMKRTGAENIYAIDAAEKMTEKAKSKFSGTAINFITADVLEYPFINVFFDHIICYSVFPHFEEKRAIIKKLSFLLKTGGLLSILHSSARAKINKTHAHIPSHGINSDFLLPAIEYIPLFNRNNLKEEIVIDNDDMYMLCGRKVK